MATQTPLQLAPEIDVGQVVLVIFYLVIIIAGAYFLTRYVAKRRMQQGMRRTGREQGGAGASSGRAAWRSDNQHMVYVVDRIPIDREKTLMVVEFEGKYYLIGTTAQDFKLFDRIPVPEAETEQQTAAEGEDGAAAEEQTGAMTANLQASDDSEETFGQRFRRAFSVVLRSYLPAGMRDRKQSSAASFEQELEARTRQRSGTKNKKDPDS